MTMHPARFSSAVRATLVTHWPSNVADVDLHEFAFQLHGVEYRFRQVGKIQLTTEPDNLIVLIDPDDLSHCWVKGRLVEVVPA